jgi:hypothetical protein
VCRGQLDVELDSLDEPVDEELEDEELVADEELDEVDDELDLLSVL